MDVTDVMQTYRRICPDKNPHTDTGCSGHRDHTHPAGESSGGNRCAGMEYGHGKVSDLGLVLYSMGVSDLRFGLSFYART